MAKNLREAALWELVMKAAHDVQESTPSVLTMNAGVISLDVTLTRLAEAANSDHEYGFALQTCIIAGLCYKILFDLASESDIQQMLTESESFANEKHRN